MWNKSDEKSGKFKENISSKATVKMGGKYQ
jgi:hypothetical protein